MRVLPAEEALPAYLEMSGWRVASPAAAPLLTRLQELQPQQWSQARAERHCSGSSSEWATGCGERPWAEPAAGDRALSCSTDLVDWSTWESDSALGTLRYLRGLYWHRLISQGSLLAVATVF